MKLLTWMHRKIRQNNSEMFKEFPHGQTIVNSHNLYPKQAHGGINLVQPPRDSCRRRSFASQESTGVDEPGRDSSTEFSESFHGFLAIGTLGAETYVSEPETPTFVTCVDNIAERETEVTQSELELINEELEKVLAAEARDDGWTDSSRSSHASNARSSNTSAVSLSRKSVEATEGNETGRAATCPLQGYLFGSGVELPGRRSTAKKNRASLGELFQRHRAEESSGAKSERGDKPPHKDGDKASTNLMKKILRKKFSSAATAEVTDYASDTKFHKAQMLHIFHKKVHPESSTDIQKLDAQSKSRSRSSVIADADKSPGGDEGLPRVCDDYKSQSTSTDGDSARNRGLWIKTDADYLVLEL